jgi:putative PIN family toxin of toxin-antitoxin system
MSVTLDVNVLLSATLWDGSVSQKLLFRLIKKDIKIYSCEEVLADYKRVIRRDFEYTDEEISDLTRNLLAFITVINPAKIEHIVIKDPDDDVIIACAIESKSTYIITYDKHLLDIKEISGIKIITPETALGIY